MGATDADSLRKRSYASEASLGCAKCLVRSPDRSIAVTRQNLGAFLVGVLVASFSCRAVAAASIADFNDLATGAINGKAGGTGWTGNWTGSAGGTVVAGDLTSSLYNVPQTATPQHYRSINATGLRQNYRVPASPF